jgi:hypothetical protein
MSNAFSFRKARLRGKHATATSPDLSTEQRRC